MNTEDIERLKQKADTLKAVWMKKRKDLRRAEEKEAKAKAEYFNAYEALITAQVSVEGVPTNAD